MTSSKVPERYTNTDKLERFVLDRLLLFYDHAKECNFIVFKLSYHLKLFDFTVVMCYYVIIHFKQINNSFNKLL